MNTSSTPVNLREAIKSLDSLPTLPLIAQKLLALKTDTDEGQKQLLLLIEQDPANTGKNYRPGECADIRIFTQDQLNFRGRHRARHKPDKISCYRHRRHVAKSRFLDRHPQHARPVDA